MNRLSALGLFTLIGLAAVGCGDDDDPTPPAGGAGGMGGTGGSMTAGSGGATGGTMMTGGSGGMGGMGVAPCTGCVELSVPYDAANEGSIFHFVFAAPVDLSTATMTWRVQVPTANGDQFLQLISQNGMELNYSGVYTSYANLTAAAFPAGQWVDVSLDFNRIPLLPGDAGAPDAAAPVADAGGADASVGDAGAGEALEPLDNPGNFDKTVAATVGIQLGAAASATAPGTVEVLVDSVTFTGVDGVPDKTFTTSAEDLVYNGGGSTAMGTVTHHP